MTIIRPDGLTAIEWTDYMVDELTQYGPIPRLEDETMWREGWAERVIQLPGIAALLPPYPHTYATWQAWADDFNRVLP
jgi:hypothetical protein